MENWMGGLMDGGAPGAGPTGDPSQSGPYSFISGQQRLAMGFGDPGMGFGGGCGGCILGDLAAGRSLGPIIKVPHSEDFALKAIGVFAGASVVGGAIGAGAAALAPEAEEIGIPLRQIAHVIARHTVAGTERKAVTSAFSLGTDLFQLIDDAGLVEPVPQAGRNTLERIVNAGVSIGWDGWERAATSVYTVITTLNNQLITLYPGRPLGK